MCHSALKHDLYLTTDVRGPLTFNIFNSRCAGTVGIIIDRVVVLLTDSHIVTIEFNLLADDSK